LLALNTIFQLAAHDRAELERAARLLLLPDLLVRTLTGFEGAERSNASTTALLEARSGAWSAELLAAVGVDAGLLPPVVPAGLPAGAWRGVAVHTVGSHDTASAFVAVPGVPGPGTVVVSSGTWVLVGTERPDADTSERARAANFSNEAGALGGVRFLKNLAGFWLLEQCRAAWGNPDVAELAAAAAAVDGPVGLVDPNDARFLAPADMEAEIRAAAGLGAAASRAEVVRCILESIAAATARVVGELAAITGTPVRELQVVGGAARIRLMNELYGRHAGVPVTVGSPEATALGNAVVQGLALGRFDGLDEARRWLATGAERVVV
jgi:rhamnulokinase